MSRRPSSRLVAAIGVLAWLLTLACGGSATAARGHHGASSAAAAPVSGRVTDASGHPLPEATVAVYHGGREEPGVSASTDSRGRYTVPDLSPGTGYRVCALSGFQTACYDDAATLDDAAEVTVGGQPLTNVDISMRAPGSLTGTVTLAGAPVADAYVSLYFRSAYLRHDDDSDYQVGSVSVVTDGHGAYTIPDLSPGSYAVRVVDSRGSTRHTYSGDVVTLRRAEYVAVASGQTSTEDIAVRVAATISGTMRAADGTPETGVVDVYPVAGDGDDEGPVYTEPDGSYSAGPLRPGRYVIRFHPDDPLLQIGWYRRGSTRAGATVVRLAAGSMRTGIDPALPAGAEITGTLRDRTSPGDPVGFPLVRLLKSDGAGGWTVVAGYEGYLGFGGGPEGYYDLRHLAPGTYRLSATELGYHDLYLPDGTTVDQGQDYQVGAGQLLTLSATMRRDTALVGQVFVDGTGGVGAGYTTVDVYVEAADGTWSLLTSDEADRTGAYRIVGLAPGTYRLGFSYPTLFPEFYDDQPTLDTATDLTVTRGHWTRANASLVPR